MTASLGPVHRRRETHVNEGFLDGVPTGRVERVKTVQRAAIIDGPTLPDARTWTKTSSPGWRPEEILVVDEIGAGEKDQPRRTVAISGRHLKKDGTLGQVKADASWRSYATFTGAGSMARLPGWVDDLVRIYIAPADPDVLVQARGVEATT